MRSTLKLRWNTELAISVLFFGPQINYYIACLLSMNGLQTITTYVYAVLYFVGLVSYIVALSRKRPFISFFAFILMLCGSAILNSGVVKFMFNSTFFASALPITLFVYFPIFLLFLGTVDFEKLIGYLLNFSIVTLILAISAFCGYLFVQKSSPPDYMSFAYMMLTPVLVCFMKGWKKNELPFILAMVGAFVVFIVGCRGAVVTMAVCFFLYILFVYSGRKNKKAFALKSILLVSIAVVAINAETILKLISIALSGIGFNSRTIGAMLEGGGTFAESEGRAAIWTQAIDNTGIIGKGLFGDRTVILDEYAHSVYAHNLILEVLVDFGWIAGSIAVAVFISYIIRAYLVSRVAGDVSLQKLVMVMISILFVKHMISASFLTSFDFWFYLGLAVHLVLHRETYLRQAENI